MAHLEKFKKAQLGGILTHVGRGVSTPSDINHSNEMIDPGLSQFNYNLVDYQDKMNDYQRIKNRVEEYNVFNRKDINWIGSWVITLPQELFDGKDKEKMLNSIQERASNGQHPLNDDQQRFFKLATDFIKQRYGADNVMYAYVHTDESTPHLHIGFTPCYYDKKKGRKATSFNDFIKRQEYQTFHRDLSKFMTKEFGRDIGILKSETQAKNAEIERLQAENEEIRQKLDAIKKTENSGQLMAEDVWDELDEQKIRLEQEQEQALDRISQIVQEKKQNIKTVTELKKETQLQEGLNKIAENSYNQTIQKREQAKQELKQIEEQAKQASNQARQELVQAQEEARQAKDELLKLEGQEEDLQEEIEWLQDIRGVREHENAELAANNQELEQEIQRQEDKLEEIRQTVADEFGSYADVELENRKLKSENKRLKEKVEFQEEKIKEQEGLIITASRVFHLVKIQMPSLARQMAERMGQAFQKMQEKAEQFFEKSRQAEEQERQMQKKTYHDFYER